MFVKSLEVKDPTSFRLITIVPGESGSPLHLCISDASFKEAKYYCLSYTWEPSGPAHQVWLNNEPRNIGHNLWLFLNSARSAGLEIPIWIDAISIDQSNVEDRNRSVSRMGDIYANAGRVFLWLGQLKRSLQTFLVGLKKLADELAIVRHSQRRNRRTAVLARLESMNAHARASWERNAVQILSLPYFERLWIAQEILLSDAAHIWLDGTQSLHMDLFSEIMIVILSHKAEDVLSQMAAMPGYKYIWWHYTTSQESRVIQGPIDLASLMPRFADSKCQLHIDRVYALLSLATNGDKFMVDYGIDTTTLFTRTMEFSMDGRPLDSLLLVGANLLELLNLLPTDPPRNQDPIPITTTTAYASPPIFRTATLHLTPTTTTSTPSVLVLISLPPNAIHLFEYAFFPGNSTKPPKITHCRIHEHLILPQASNGDKPMPPQLPAPHPAILHDKAYYIHTPIPSESLHYFTLNPSFPFLHSWSSPPLSFPSPSTSPSSSPSPTIPAPTHPCLPPPHLSPSTHSLPTTVVWDAYFQRETAHIFDTVTDIVVHEAWTQLRVSEARSDALVGTGLVRREAVMVAAVAAGGGRDGSGVIKGHGVRGGDACGRRVGNGLVEGGGEVEIEGKVSVGGDGAMELVAGGRWRWGASVRVTREMMRVRRIVCMRRPDRGAGDTGCR